MKIFFALILFLFTCKSYCDTLSAEIEFYNKKFTILYDNSIFLDISYKPGDDGYFEFYYERMEATLYTVLFKDLQEKKQSLALNDWLYYQLLNNSVKVILRTQKDYMRNLFLWFMLNKSGYETRLEFKGKDVTVSVFSNDLVYGVPQSKGKGGYYIDLTSFNNDVDYKKWEPFRLNYNPNKGLKTNPFQFTISQLPAVFESKIVEKEISFTHQGKTYSVKIPLDSGYVEFLNGYPELSVLKHTEIKLSPGAYQALIPFLKENCNGLDSVQTIRLLLSFCRTGFNFKKDEQAFAETPYFGGTGQKIIFAPEESLLSKYVDSEDISVLFYYLSKEILNPEMVLLKYGKNVSVATYLHKKTSSPIMYNNKPFALCDVYLDNDTIDVGEVPKTLMGKTPAIIEK